MKVGYCMSEKDFDFDFDFEKEYGFDTPEDTAAQQSDIDFDLKALLESEFGDEAALFTSEYDSDFDYGPETVDYLQDEGMEEEPVPETPVEVELTEEDLLEEDLLEEELPEDDLLEDDLLVGNFEEEPLDEGFDAELPENMMSAEPLPVEEYEEPVEEAPAPVQEEAPVRRERRKPVSPMRRFKNETMPLIITGITALLIVIFVIGSVTRLVGSIKHNREAELNASEAAESEAQRQDQEAQNLLDEAARLAAGYDYDTAIAKLEGFTGSKEKYPEMEIRLSEYKQQKSLLVAHNDPGAIPNLSFHMLIADPSRAFSNREFGGQYNRNFVTIDEFEKILNQLYINGYVLVDMDSFIAETVTGETITYSSKSLYLPDGKKPFMMTETMVNYFNYMIDGNADGVPDKDGAGFASKLVLRNGEIKAERSTAWAKPLWVTTIWFPFWKTSLKHIPTSPIRVPAHCWQ